MFYPPYFDRWAEKTTVDTLTAWEMLGDSILFWGEDLWFAVVADERRFVWKTTLYCGTTALILLILLFLEPITTRFHFAKTNFEQITPEPVVKQKVVEKKEKPIDPFSAFEPLSKQPITVPPVTHFPVKKPEVIWSPPVEKNAKLSTSVARTDLNPDFYYSEISATSKSTGHYQPNPLEEMVVDLKWKQYLQPSLFEFGNTEKKRISWIETAKSKPVLSASLKQPTILNSVTASGDIVLTKILPGQISKNSTTTYTLVVENQGTQPRNNIVVEEQITDKMIVHTVFPEAHLAGDSIQWVIDTLNPGEKREFRITGSAEQGSKVIKSESRLGLSYGIRTQCEVVVPDVVVSLTVPDTVQKQKNFPVEVEITNNSDQFFPPTHLKIDCKKGIVIKGIKQHSQSVELPAPGKSIRFPLTLTAVENGSAFIEAKLDLDDILIIPVKAQTEVFENETEAPKHKRNAIARKLPSQIVTAN